MGSTCLSLSTLTLKANLFRTQWGLPPVTKNTHCQLHLPLEVASLWPWPQPSLDILLTPTIDFHERRMRTMLPWKRLRGLPPSGSLPRLPQPIRNLLSELRGLDCP